jgi:hypothetical protein
MSWPRVFHLPSSVAQHRAARPGLIAHEGSESAVQPQADVLSDRIGRGRVPCDVAFDFILGGLALGPMPPRR